MNRLRLNPDLKHQKVQRLVMQDRRISVRMISKAVGISIGPVKTVLTQDLKLHKVCTKFVPKIPSDDQMQFCMRHVTSPHW